jgi:hypothetical protein
MEISDGIKFLVEKYSSYDWYDSVGLDYFKRYVVYVTTMNYEIMTTVQQDLEGKQVLIHYANSKPENLKKYHSVITVGKAIEPTPVKVVEETIEEEDIISVDDLIAELNRLEKICGTNMLQDIFFEVHDGKNAVTNLSNKFPEVRRSMNDLFEEYGFDVIYDELDG